MLTLIDGKYIDVFCRFIHLHSAANVNHSYEGICRTTHL